MLHFLHQMVQFYHVLLLLDLNAMEDRQMDLFRLRRLGQLQLQIQQLQL